MKLIISFLFCISIFGQQFTLPNLASETGGNSNTLPMSKKLNIIDLTASLGGGGWSDDLITLKTGDYKFDAVNDQWLLKTKSRLLGVKKIDLIDKYYDKQIEVNGVSSNVKSRRGTFNSRFLELYLKKSVKFENYKIKDFNF